MTKDELRIAVAVARGWRYGIHPSTDTPVWENPEGRECRKEDIPNYPDSMDACMPLIEEMTGDASIDFVGVLYGNDPSAWFGQEDLLTEEAKGDTEAEAVCNLYLAWKEGQ